MWSANSDVPIVETVYDSDDTSTHKPGTREKKETFAKKQEEQLKRLTQVIDTNTTVEDLIHEIEKRPSIWDYRVKGYANKIDKLNAWNEILAHFIPEFENKPTEEKNILVTIVQKKWKGVRSCYTRELLRKKNEKSGSRAASRKQYVHFDQLRFLEAVPKKTESSMAAEEAGEDDNVEEEDPDALRSDCSDTQSPLDTSFVEPKPVRKREYSNNSDNELFTVLLKKALQNDNDDEDKLFLLSLLSEIKKVPPQNKLQLRSNIIAVIAQAQQSTQQQWPPSQPLVNQLFSNSGPSQQSQPYYDTPRTPPSLRHRKSWNSQSDSSC
ncbi:uncharacterized protein LOC128990639 [Macrosteles quadrilineatus]|uniref:uncharacterized protein LOC128990639 n=1 Tax=Macrosteles quadrilineatus TaxID=74068 RepID=UPI0023E1838F|nr:uncharacterized protein LOC128990639 [Macrosteles quadrilineatus]